MRKGLRIWIQQNAYLLEDKSVRVAFLSSSQDAEDALSLPTTGDFKKQTGQSCHQDGIRSPILIRGLD